MRIICVIDMQNDFIDAALGTPEAQAVTAPLAAFLTREKDRATFVATRDTHGADYLNTNEGKHLPVPHCLKGTPGWDLNPAVAAALGDCRVLDKPNFGISAARWEEVLTPLKPTEILLTGLCTDICVVSNALALKTAFPEIPVKCVRDLCAGVTPASHEAALTTMSMCQVDLVNAAEVD